MNRKVLERVGVGAAALACFVLAIGLGLLALDVARAQDVLHESDVDYRVAPTRPGLWSPTMRAPFVSAETILGVEDDVALRQAMRSIRNARLDDPTAFVSDPKLALQRNDAQARLDAIVTNADDPRQRSLAAGLLGVLGLARLASETQDRVALLSATVANLQLAIALDPDNDDAKYNLELALQRARGIQLIEGAGGQNPTPGGSGASGAGAGEPGSGY
jgi:hypothetical protein